MNNTTPIIGKENQYEYKFRSCGATAYEHKGRCVCDDCKATEDGEDAAALMNADQLYE